MVADLYRIISFGIMSAFAGQMFLEASFEIGRYAGIKRFIFTFKKINEVGHPTAENAGTVVGDRRNSVLSEHQTPQSVFQDA